MLPFFFSSSVFKNSSKREKARSAASVSLIVLPRNASKLENILSAGALSILPASARPAFRITSSCPTGDGRARRSATELQAEVCTLPPPRRAAGVDVGANPCTATAHKRRPMESFCMAYECIIFFLSPECCFLFSPVPSSRQRRGGVCGGIVSFWDLRYASSKQA